MMKSSKLQQQHDNCVNYNNNHSNEDAGEVDEDDESSFIWYLCKYCKLTFKTKPQLNLHKKKEHLDQLQVAFFRKKRDLDEEEDLRKRVGEYYDIEFELEQPPRPLLDADESMTTVSPLIVTSVKETTITAINQAKSNPSQVEHQSHNYVDNDNGSVSRRSDELSSSSSTAEPSSPLIPNSSLPSSLKALPKDRICVPVIVSRNGLNSGVEFTGSNSPAPKPAIKLIPIAMTEYNNNCEVIDLTDDNGDDDRDEPQDNSACSLSLLNQQSTAVNPQYEYQSTNLGQNEVTNSPLVPSTSATLQVTLNNMTNVVLENNPILVSQDGLSCYTIVQNIGPPSNNNNNNDNNNSVTRDCNNDQQSTRTSSLNVNTGQFSSSVEAIIKKYICKDSGHTSANINNNCNANNNHSRSSNNNNSYVVETLNPSPPPLVSTNFECNSGDSGISVWNDDCVLKTVVLNDEVGKPPPLVSHMKNSKSQLLINKIQSQNGKINKNPILRHVLGRSKTDGKNEGIVKCYYNKSKTNGNIFLSRSTTIVPLNQNQDQVKVKANLLNSQKKCKLCGKGYMGILELKRHVEDAHMYKWKELIVSKHLCKICKLEFPSSQSLINHLRIGHSTFSLNNNNNNKTWSPAPKPLLLPRPSSSSTKSSRQQTQTSKSDEYRINLPLKSTRRFRKSSSSSNSDNSSCKSAHKNKIILPKSNNKSSGHMKSRGHDLGQLKTVLCPKISDDASLSLPKPNFNSNPSNLDCNKLTCINCSQKFTEVNAFAHHILRCV